ncbi:hypothetical protein EV702DRAFT_919830, partial [Suillus placidus]
PMMIPKTLTFHNNKQEAAATYNNSCLPKDLQNQGIIKHYHSDMSVKYLQQTYDDFALVTGACCIIHGLDIQGVWVIIQYSFLKNMSEAAQQGGRAIHNGHSCGLFLMMVETWALEAGL